MTVLAAVFALMLALNFMVPLFNDDYFYVLNLKSETVISGFADVLNSISGFRNGHNGRIAAHFFVQLFLWLPRAFFIIANSALYTLLVYMVYRFAKTEDRKTNVILIFCSAAMLWVLLPAFGHAFLWLTGSCSYLWAIAFILLFLHPFFYRYMQGEKQYESRGCAFAVNVFALAYAFFAGAYSENGSFSALAVAFCFLLLIIVKEKKMPICLGLRFIAACAGFLYLMLSPSELGKKDAGSEGFSLPLLESVGIGGTGLALLALAALVFAAVMLWGIIKRHRAFCSVLAKVSAAALVILLMLVICREFSTAGNILEGINGAVSNVPLNLILLFGIYFSLLMWALSIDADGKVIMSALIFGIGAVASLAVFLVAIYFPARGACVAAVYTTVADLMLLAAVWKKRGAKPLKLYAAVFLVLLLPTLIAGVADVHSVYAQYRQRVLVIEQAQERNAEELVLEPIIASGKYGVPWQGEAADYYYGMQEYYGIDRIIIEGAEEF